MIRIRSRLFLHQDRMAALVLERPPLGRLFNAIAFILILITTIFALSSGEGPTPFGTAFLLIFSLLFFHNSAVNKLYRFSVPENQFSIIHRILGLTVRKQEFPIDIISAVALAAVEFNLRRADNPGLYHLQLLLNHQQLPARMTIEDSSDPYELQACATRLSSYLSVRLETE